MRAAIYARIGAAARRHPLIVIILGIACLIALFTVLGLDPGFDQYPTQ